MYKLSIYLVVTYFPTQLVIKVKPTINSVEVHPQLSNNRHPVDDALVVAGSVWPTESITLTPSWSTPTDPGLSSSSKNKHTRQEDPELFRTTKNRTRVLMIWEVSM
jgi:hypothetical protein